MQMALAAGVGPSACAAVAELGPWPVQTVGLMGLVVGAGGRVALESSFETTTRKLPLLLLLPLSSSLLSGVQVKPFAQHRAHV